MDATNQSPPDYWRKHQAEIEALLNTITPESALVALRFTAQECADGTYLAVHLCTNLRWAVGRQDALRKAGAQ